MMVLCSLLLDGKCNLLCQVIADVNFQTIFANRPAICRYRHIGPAFSGACDVFFCDAVVWRCSVSNVFGNPDRLNRHAGIGSRGIPHTDNLRRVGVELRGSTDDLKILRRVRSYFRARYSRSGGSRPCLLVEGSTCATWQRYLPRFDSGHGCAHMQFISCNEACDDDRSASYRRRHPDGLRCVTLHYDRAGGVIAKALPFLRKDSDQETDEIHPDRINQPKQIANQRLSKVDLASVYADNA